MPETLRQQVKAVLHGHSSEARVKALVPELRTAIMSADDPEAVFKLAIVAYDSDSRELDGA